MKKKRREFLRNMTAAATGGAVALTAENRLSQSRATSQRNEPHVVLEGGIQEYFDVEMKQATQNSSTVHGVVLLKNTSGENVSARFETYFEVTLNGETYAFQASEAHHNIRMNEERDIRSEVVVDENGFQLDKFIVVLENIR